MQKKVKTPGVTCNQGGFMIFTERSKLLEPARSTHALEQPDADESKTDLPGLGRPGNGRKQSGQKKGKH